MGDVKANQAYEQHGGNLSMIAALYPDAPQPWIDLSTGINPYPYPLPSHQPEWHHRLADHADMQAALEAVATHLFASFPRRRESSLSAKSPVDSEDSRLRGNDTITLSPGMQPLMFALAALRLKNHGASRISILSPTYREHATTWQTMGHTIIPAASIEDMAQSDVAILCNPNNPDGRTHTPQQLLALARQVDWLIVDESFADLTPELSIASQVANADNIAVLRSCGKFYGIAGMRVSMAIAPVQWTQWLRVATGSWPISTQACHLLPKMLHDEAWITAMRNQLTQESAHWRGVLSQYFTLVGHTPLFTLVSTENTAVWHAHLAAQGILTRKFSYNPHWLRFGLPDRSSLPRVETALTGLKQS